MVPTAAVLDVRGTPVDLRRAGSGPPLLYLHAGGGDSQWLPLFDRFAERYTVYHPSHPGFGQSGGLDHVDGIEDLVFHYLDVITALGLDVAPLNVAGSSFGGWVAVELAHRYPAAVGRLVLIDAAGLWLDEAPMAEMFGNEPQEMARLLFHDQKHPLAVAMAAISDLSQLPEEVILPQFKAMEALARVAWNPYFHNPKLERRLDRITAPTLVVWGRQDRLIPLAHGERYAARIPGARLAVIDNCGHLPALERPDELYTLLMKFLDTAARAGASAAATAPRH
ncbi:MAG: alpha/beta fold hydrolase [Candidatus Binatia bacterium]